MPLGSVVVGDGRTAGGHRSDGGVHDDAAEVPRADSLGEAEGSAATVPIDGRGMVFSGRVRPSASEPITVLHVDDDDSFLDLTRAFLEQDDRLRVRTDTRIEPALDRLADVECVVSDFDMPDRDGLAFLDAVRSRRPDLPFILFTGKGSEEIASEAISAGVTDYLRKGTGTERYDVLINRITNAVEQVRATDAAAESSRRLSRLVSNLPGLAYRCTPEDPWPMVFLGGEVEAILGHEPSALVDGDVNLGDLILDEDEPRVTAAVAAAIDRGEAFEVTYRLRNGDAERRVYEHGQPVYEGGDIVALEGFIMDLDRHGPVRESA